MFDRELDYYGITSDEADIKHHTSMIQIADSFLLPLAEAQKKHDMFFLALDYYKLFLEERKKNTKIDNYSFKCIGHKNNEDEKLFYKYLRKYFDLLILEGNPFKGKYFNIGIKKWT